MPRISIEEFDGLCAGNLPMAQYFGFRIETLERGHAVGRLPYAEQHLRPGGTISGPSMMALADYVMYAVVLSLIGRVEMAVTTNLSINFLRRPGPIDLLGDGRILKLGRQLAYGEVELRTDGVDDLVAHATLTYSIPPEHRDG